ncbi:hypothetical protein BH09PSE2_BH09PSE2_05910 [soil metagenome]
MRSMVVGASRRTTLQKRLAPSVGFAATSPAAQGRHGSSAGMVGAAVLGRVKGRFA